MLTIPLSTEVGMVMLYDTEGPIGTCHFINNTIVFHATHAEQQAEIELVLQAKYHTHARLAREEGRMLSKADFFADMPRFVHGVTLYATRPSRSFAHTLPADLKELLSAPFQPVKRRKR